MQYEQKLLHPYMIDTHALRFDERTTGLPSAMLPAESSTAKMRLPVFKMCRRDRHISARVCAVLWLLPGYLYFLAQVSSVQRADPGGERMLVLHASGTLVTVLLACLLYTSRCV